MSGPASGATASATASAATQQIRLAVVLNGGVSLAIWMSGVTHELNRLVQASRAGAAGGDAYGDLLRALGAEARIDVIAGTSAGGINGGFLALGLVHGRDLDGLRTLWQSAGSLSALLRNPRDKNQPSLLRGTYFHRELADAYDKIWAGEQRISAVPGEDVDLFLTGTLWQGRRSFFADDMGRRITERDYDATFHFTSDSEVLGLTDESRKRGNLRSTSVTGELAVASRCTASFPAAFEPFPVELDAETAPADAVPLADGRWPSDAGRVNFRPSQFVIDGGILRNKPVRPAIDAVYRQPARLQVRRVLAYVVPDPGEPATGPGKPAVSAVPNATDVMLGVMTRLRSTDSVAEELAEIRRRNEETTHRRSARDRMAQTLVDAAAAQCAETLLRSAYPGYREIRRDDSARSVARLLLSSPLGRGWSHRELVTELQVLFADTRLPFVPQPDLGSALTARGADWRWGQATVRRLGDLVVDVLKRAVWLAPLDDARRTTIVAQRERSHDVLQTARGDRILLDAFWRAAGRTEAPPAGRRRGATAPVDDADVAATREELRSLRAKLGAVAGAWNDAAEAEVGGGTVSHGPYELMTARLYRRAVRLADCLREAGDALRSIADGGSAPVDPDGREQERLRSLVELLLPGGATTDDVLQNMLRLEVLHVAFTGVSDTAEQNVELVQVSSVDKKLVTGIQLHHFGAFYRESWRANDWLRGRLDGSEQLIQMLLAPERLRQLGVTTAQDALTRLHPVAVGPQTNPWRAELDEVWKNSLPELTAELRALEESEPLPRTFPLTAERIADRLRVELLPAELLSLAEAVVHEPDPVQPAVQWADRVRLDLHGHANATPPTHAPRAELLAMLERSKVVGSQTIEKEGERGSDTFAQTATHAAATLTATVASIKKPKVAVTLLKSLRGYALLLWVLVNFATGRSNFGRNTTYLIVGVGGALVGLALLVPGVPAIVPLAGVVVILAAASAAALRMGKRGRVWLFLRFVVALVLTLVALGAVVWQRAEAADQPIEEALKGLIPPAAVVVAVVFLGWFVGRPAKQAA